MIWDSSGGGFFLLLSPAGVERPSRPAQPCSRAADWHSPVHKASYKVRARHRTEPLALFDTSSQDGSWKGTTCVICARVSFGLALRAHMHNVSLKTSDVYSLLHFESISIWNKLFVLQSGK